MQFDKKFDELAKRANIDTDNAETGAVNGRARRRDIGGWRVPRSKFELRTTVSRRGTRGSLHSSGAGALDETTGREYQQGGMPPLGEAVVGLGAEVQSLYGLNFVACVQPPVAR